MILLCSFSVLSFSADLSSWPQSQYNLLNNKYLNNDVFGNSLTSVQSVNVGNESILPVTFDINQDGFSDMILYNGGMIQIYIYDSSSSSFSLVSEYPQNAISTPFIYLRHDNNINLVMFNSTNLFVFNFSNNQLVLDSNILLNGTITLNTISSFNKSENQQYIRPSVNCIASYGSDLCVLKLDGSSFEIINVSDSTNPVQFTISDGDLYPLSNYKPLIYLANYGSGYQAVFYCNISEHHGLASYSLITKTLQNKKCNLESTTNYFPFGSPMQIDDMAGGTKMAFVSVLDSGSSAFKIHLINSAWNEISGYPLPFAGYRFHGFASYNGILRICYGQALDYISGYDIAGILNSTLSLPNTGGGYTSESTFFMSNKMAYCNGRFTNSSTYLNTPSFISSQYKDAIMSVINSNLFVFVNNNSKINIYMTITPPLTYPNATFFFRNSMSNLSVGVTDFLVQQDINPVLYGETLSDGSIYVGSYLSSGNYSMIIQNMTGYNYYNVTFSIINGTKPYYFYLSQNSTFLSQANIIVYNSANGLQIDNALINAYVSNSTGAIVQNQNSTTGVFNFNLSTGNYSFSFISPDSIFQTFYSNKTIIAGSVNLEFGLIPVLSLIPTIPMILNVSSYHFIVNQYDDVSEYAEIQADTICLNDSIYLNSTLLKKDNKGTYLNFVCDDKNISNTIPAQYVDYSQFFPYNFIYRYNALGSCKYNESGDKNIKIWASSPDYPFSFSSFANLSGYGAVTLKINVRADCSGIQINDLRKTSKNDKPATNFIKAIFSLFGATSPEAVSQMSLVVVFIFALCLGLTALAVTHDFSGLMFGLGGGGFLGILFFFAFQCIGLGTAFLFSIAFISLGSLALYKSFAGGTPQS